MTKAPAIIASGLCSTAGCGVQSACELAFSNSQNLKPQNLFESPRHFAKLTGQCEEFGVSKNAPRCAKMLEFALSEALKKIDLKDIKRERISVYLGTSIGGIFETENAISDLIDHKSNKLSALNFYECSTLAELAARKANAKGECATFSTACSSSSLALCEACNAIIQNLCDIAIVCGADALSRITVNGFGSLLLLSQTNAKPFDKNRDGINLGEAAAVVILASEDALKRMQMRPLARISGWAATADAYHPTSPQPEAEGLARAFSKSLARAGKNPLDISFYLAHGTATKGNDLSESKALKNVFKEFAPAFASIKGKFGHTLGASGLLNLIIATEAIAQSKAPLNTGFETFDEDLGISPNTKSTNANLKSIMFSSVGFGGNNSCAIVENDESQNIKSPQKNEIFIYKSGTIPDVSNSKSAQNSFANFTQKNFRVSEENLLSQIPILKKRKWAKLQQMALEAASEAVKDLNFDAKKTAVCFGTGLGMVEETRRFVETTLINKETKPLPTAFTNSVHNAAASLISMQFKFKGLNSAVTAKEISFEAALSQSIKEINSGDCDCAIAGSADEFSQYSEDFLKFKGITHKPISDLAAAYLIAKKGAINSKPFAKILALQICRAEKSPEAEARQILNTLCDKSIAKSDIAQWFVPTFLYASKCNFLKSLQKQLNVNFFDLSEVLGANYSTSAFAPALAQSKGRGIYASYSLSSAGMRALTIFEIL